MTDGTKDFTINALTCNGAIVFNSHVTLGNGSTDDITFTGSLASTIPIKTTNSFNIGSATLGLAGIYFGSSDSDTTRLKGASTIASSFTLTLPASAGNASEVIETDGSGNLSFAQPLPVNGAKGYSLSAAVATNALTVTLKGSDGNDLSSTNKAVIAFRHSTLTTGTPVVRTITANLTVTVPSSQTLGHTSGADEIIYVYAIDNAGTVELALCSSKHKDCLTTHNTSAISSATNPYTLYSTTARTGVAIRLIGRLKVNEVTAGTWATAPSEVSLIGDVHLGSGALDYVVRYAELSWSGGTPQVDKQSKPNWINTGSLTDNGAGDVTLALISGAFSEAPIPSALGNIDTGAHGDVFVNGAPSTSALRLKVARTTTEGGSDAFKIYLHCAGKP